jgi:hypothetical protein
MVHNLNLLTDWHPAIHTLMIWLLTRLWDSPAVVVIAQIIIMSLVAAWGICGLEEWGLSRRGAWLLSLVFAVSPVNGNMAVTLWKDVPYGISFFAFFLMVFRIVMSEGKWLDRRGRWLAMGLVATATGLFRHNGVAVAGVLLLILFAVYWRHWKALLKSAVLFMALWAIVTGPVYDLAKVHRVSSTLRDTIYLHHFAAHVAAGTPLTEEERSYFNSLEPLSSWYYDCCNVTPLYFNPNFNKEVFQANRSKHLAFFLDLAMRNPGVEIKHMICSSSLVWKICYDCGFLANAIFIEDGNYHWIVQDPTGPNEASLVPRLVKPLGKISLGSTLPPWRMWVWGPALYLYIAIWSVVLFAVKHRSAQMLLISLPAVIQSAILMVINISADFRYQYSVYLMGLFSIGLVLMLFSRPPSIGQKN